MSFILAAFAGIQMVSCGIACLLLTEFRRKHLEDMHMLSLLPGTEVRAWQTRYSILAWAYGVTTAAIFIVSTGFFLLQQ